MTDTYTPLVSRLEDSGLLLGGMMNPPPAERKGTVVPFELTSGCSYNGCNYCSMFKGEKYRVRTSDDFKFHVDNVFRFIEKEQGEAGLRRLERIFIGSGNALAVDARTLNSSIQYAISAFKRKTGKLPRRIATYGNTRDIVAKGERDLKFLECGGTCGNCSIDLFGKKLGLKVVYWGIESGSQEVLDYANKGNPNGMLDIAVDNFRYSGLEASVMIMNGLGGIALSDEHIDDTSRVLNRLRPRWITFIGTHAEKDTAYARKMTREEEAGTNRSLTSLEMAEQMARIIENLNFDTTVGCFGSELQAYGRNDVAFGSAVLSIGVNSMLAEYIRCKATDGRVSSRVADRMRYALVADASGKPLASKPIRYY